MNLKECLYKAVKSYFILVTLITAAILILGMIFDPNATFGYKSLMAPLKYAALGVIPTFVLISDKELSPVQLLIRNAIQLVIIEAEILFCISETADEGTLFFVGLSVFAVFVLVHIITMLNDYFTAKKLTNDLAILQKNAEFE